MRPTFLPRLVNPPYEDPALYIPFSHQNTAILFDAGDLERLTPRELLKIDHIFITHTHMDHFSGFDRLLRLVLGREKILNLFGPEGFLDNLEGKLNSYQWNLVEKYTYPLVIQATEVTGSKRRSQTYCCQNRFQPKQPKTVRAGSTTLIDTPSAVVAATVLDHRIPCLGLALKEPFHINIMKSEMERLGLSPGPWLKQFKNRLYRNDPVEAVVTVPEPFAPPSANEFQAGELAASIARITPGQKIAYITDVGFTTENIQKIQNIAQGADHLFIEAAFLQKDHIIAAKKYHLTARQAGYIAALNGVQRLTVFHFSPRYTDHFSDIGREAIEAFNHYRRQPAATPP